MAILSQEEADTVTENMLALTVLANYVRLKHGAIRLSCHVTDIPSVIEPKLAAQVVDLAERRECTRVIVEVAADRVFATFELPSSEQTDG